MKIMFAVLTEYLVSSFVPYGTGIVATLVKNAGFEVSILMPDGLKESAESYTKRLVAEVESKQIDVVAIGGMSINYPNIEKLIAAAKKAGAITVLGGFIVDSAVEIVAGNVGADYCVYGEGEYTFIELMQALCNKSDVNDVCGLAYKSFEGVIVTPPRECITDLDTLPFIDVDLCHFDYSLELNPILTLALSRSCPFNCTFCYQLKGSRYRTKSLDYTFRELDYYLDRFKGKIKQLYVLDDLFGTDKTRVLQFCERIKEYMLPFDLQLRVDCVDEECIIALKNAGAIRIRYGLESASNKVLASMKKQYSIEQAKSTLALTHKHGVHIMASLIIGDIEDTIDTVRESEAFYREYAYQYDISILLIQTFPGTHLYRYAIDNGKINDELEFLKMGCPYVNVSKLPDNIYKLLIDKYHGGHPAWNVFIRRPLENDHSRISVSLTGDLSYFYYCPACYHEIHYTGTTTHGLYSNCPECHQIIYFMLSKSYALYSDLNASYIIRNLVEILLRDYLGSRVVIWGVNDAIRTMLLSSQTLRDMIVKVVDINYQRFNGESYCGLPVESTEALKYVKFDYILSPTVKRRHEIINSLNSMGITTSFIDIDASFYDRQNAEGK